MKRTQFSPNNALYIEHKKNTEKFNMPIQHYHDAYEIYLQLDGKRYAFYDNIWYTLKCGDMAIFKPFDIHFFESKESDYYERYGLNFQLDCFSNILSNEEKYLLTEKLNSCIIHLSEEQTKALYDHFKRVDYLSKRTGFLSEKLTHSALLLLVAYATECIDNRVVTEGHTVAPQIISALKYINKHYKENISLDDIAKTAHISKFYFCRKFHSTTGATVLEYLNNVRLTKVHNLLLSTTMTIDEIAAITGFSSAVNLTRAFKNVYGSSPREFRKTKKQD